MPDFQAYEDWLIGSGTYQPTTARAAVRSMIFLARVLDVDHCTQDEIMHFVRSQVQKGRRNKTIENQLQALRYYRIFRKSPIEAIRLRKQKSRESWVPSDADVSRVFHFVDNVPDPSRKAFYRALVYVLAYTGARIGEVSSLQLGDVLTDETALYIRAEKNEASRIIAVPVHVIEAVQEYVRHFRAATDPRALFCGPKGAMSRDRLRMVIREIGKKAGVPLLHSHAFRHRVATSLFNAGADLRSVQQHLGHVSPLSTRVYDHGDRQLASRNNADLLNAYYKGVRKGAKYECLAGRDITTRGEGFARILRIPVVLVSPFRHPLAGEASC